MESSCPLCPLSLFRDYPSPPRFLQCLSLLPIAGVVTFGIVYAGHANPWHGGLLLIRNRSARITFELAQPIARNSYSHSISFGLFRRCPPSGSCALLFAFVHTVRTHLVNLASKIRDRDHRWSTSLDEGRADPIVESRMGGKSLSSL